MSSEVLFSLFVFQFIYKTQYLEGIEDRFVKKKQVSRRSEDSLKTNKTTPKGQ